MVPANAPLWSIITKGRNNENNVFGANDEGLVVAVYIVILETKKRGLLFHVNSVRCHARIQNVIPPPLTKFMDTKL